jgi:two-component system phosphate regulon response regulator PhoB
MAGTAATILVVEDEPDIRELLSATLRREGYLVRAAATGDEALAEVRHAAPDLVLLDLLLPGLDGTEVCRRLKGGPATRAIPVVMLTARGSEGDMVAGLELGADDYVTKPFSARVLMARIRTVLRRAGAAVPGEVLNVGAVSIDLGRRLVTCAGAKRDLTATEFALLVLLARRPGWVFSRDQIINAIRGDDYPVTERSVDVQVLGLRKNLGRCGALVETVRGAGYRLREVRA